MSAYLVGNGMVRMTPFYTGQSTCTDVLAQMNAQGTPNGDMLVVPCMSLSSDGTGECLLLHTL